MNKTHRVVWSAARGAFVVAHEFAASAGKRSCRKSIIAQSIGAAAFAVLAAPSLAQTTINGATGSQTLTQQPTPETLVITNTGTITAAPTGGYAGVTGGTITAAGITNSGTILGATQAGEADTLDGVYLSGTTLTNGITNSGTASYIHGQSYGIDLVGSSSVAAVVNGGTINGGVAGIVASGATVSTISNVGTASAITGNQTGMLIEGSSSIVSITNQGLISGATLTGIVIGDATVTTLNNSEAGAEITGGRNGVLVDTGGAISNLINAGTISGNQDGIYIRNGGSVGSITNSGLIQGEDGISVATATLGGVVNSGTISGEFGILVGDNAVLGSLVNTGTIYTGVIGVYGYESAITGGITNAGSIVGSAAGIGVEAVTISGGVTNQAGGVISGASGLALYDSTVDFITNKQGATITGSSTNETGLGGVVLYSSTVTGQIVNAGVITGVGYGISAASGVIAGGISNSGLISGGTIGIGLSGTYGGLLVGGITNTGAAATISGGATGIYIGDGATVTGGIFNSGTIKGGQNGIAMAYVAGTSSGETFLGVSLSGGIVNSGVIAGTSVAGIALSGVAMSGGITNLKGGTISGGATGISVTNAATVMGGLTNSGVISGGTYSVYVDSTSSLGPITIGGVNSAQFIGDVHAPASDVTVSSGSMFSATNVFDVSSFNVASGGTVILSDPASTSGGASGITVANGFNNAGTVSVALGTTGVINGAYTQSASGTYKLGASSVSDYGVLTVNGAVDLPNAAKIYVDVASNNTLTNKEVLKGVITSTGLTASTFDVTDNLDLVSFTGVIDGNNVDLVTKVNALVLADVLANGNYNAVPAAEVIDALIASNTTGPFTPIIDDLAKLQTSQQVSRAVSQFLPLLSGASNVSSIGTLWQLDQVIQSRLEGNTGLSSGDDYVTDRGAWVKPFGTWGNQSDQGSAPGFTSNTGGLVLGADGAVSQETRVGLAFAYASSDITGKGADASNENKVDMYQVVGYGSYALDPVTQVNVQVDGGGNSNSGHRAIPAFGTNANSSYNSSTAHFGIGLGRNMPIDDETIFTPSVRMDYTWVRSDSYNETGAGPLDLNVQSTSAEQLLTSVDAKITHKVNDYASVFGNVGAGYDSLARNNTQIISAFAGAPGLPFATQGIGLKPWTVLAGFGVVATPQGGPEITVRYDLQDRSSFTEQSFSVKARWAF